MIDEHFEILTDPLRRRLLVNLLEQYPHEAIEPESVHLGAQELERVRTEMFHVHLPKLEETDIVRWNRDSNEVGKGLRFDEIQPLLSLIDTHSDELPYNWPEGE